MYRPKLLELCERKNKEKDGVSTNEALPTISTRESEIGLQRQPEGHFGHQVERVEENTVQVDRRGSTPRSTLSELEGDVLSAPEESSLFECVGGNVVMEWGIALKGHERIHRLKELSDKKNDTTLKKKRSISRDKRKRSTSRERSSEQKSRSVRNDKKTQRKNRDRSTLKDRKKSTSEDVGFDRKLKNLSLDGSTEEMVVAVCRERSTSRIKSQACESHVENLVEKITETEVENPDGLTEIQSGNQNVDFQKRFQKTKELESTQNKTRGQMKNLHKRKILGIIKRRKRKKGYDNKKKRN
jgi:hypothetical protein